jgi:hypothetical protein
MRQSIVLLLTIVTYASALSWVNEPIALPTTVERDDFSATDCTISASVEVRSPPSVSLTRVTIDGVRVTVQGASSTACGAVALTDVTLKNGAELDFVDGSLSCSVSNNIAWTTRWQRVTLRGASRLLVANTTWSATAVEATWSTGTAAVAEFASFDLAEGSTVAMTGNQFSASRVGNSFIQATFVGTGWESDETSTVELMGNSATGGPNPALSIVSQICNLRTAPAAFTPLRFSCAGTLRSLADGTAAGTSLELSSPSVELRFKNSDIGAGSVTVQSPNVSIAGSSIRGDGSLTIQEALLNSVSFNVTLLILANVTCVKAMITGFNTVVLEGGTVFNESSIQGSGTLALRSGALMRHSTVSVGSFAVADSELHNCSVATVNASSFRVSGSILAHSMVVSDGLKGACDALVLTSTNLTSTVLTVTRAATACRVAAGTSWAVTLSNLVVDEASSLRIANGTLTSVAVEATWTTGTAGVWRSDDVKVMAGGTLMLEDNRLSLSREGNGYYAGLFVGTGWRLGDATARLVLQGNVASPGATASLQLDCACSIAVRQGGFDGLMVQCAGNAEIDWSNEAPGSLSITAPSVVLRHGGTMGRASLTIMTSNATFKPSLVQGSGMLTISVGTPSPNASSRPVLRDFSFSGGGLIVKGFRLPRLVAENFTSLTLESCVVTAAASVTGGSLQLISSEISESLLRATGKVVTSAASRLIDSTISLSGGTGLSMKETTLNRSQVLASRIVAGCSAVLLASVELANRSGIQLADCQFDCKNTRPIVYIIEVSNVRASGGSRLLLHNNTIYGSAVDTTWDLGVVGIVRMSSLKFSGTGTTFCVTGNDVRGYGTSKWSAILAFFSATDLDFAEGAAARFSSNAVLGGAASLAFKGGCFVRVDHTAFSTWSVSCNGDADIVWPSAIAPVNGTQPIHSVTVTAPRIFLRHGGDLGAVTASFTTPALHFIPRVIVTSGSLRLASGSVSTALALDGLSASVADLRLTNVIVTRSNFTRFQGAIDMANVTVMRSIIDVAQVVTSLDTRMDYCGVFTADLALARTTVSRSIVTCLNGSRVALEDVKFVASYIEVADARSAGVCYALRLDGVSLDASGFRIRNTTLYCYAYLDTRWSVSLKRITATNGSTFALVNSTWSAHAGFNPYSCGAVGVVNVSNVTFLDGSSWCWERVALAATSAGCGKVIAGLSGDGLAFGDGSRFSMGSLSLPATLNSVAFTEGPNNATLDSSAASLVLQTAADSSVMASGADGARSYCPAGAAVGACAAARRCGDVIDFSEQQMWIEDVRRLIEMADSVSEDASSPADEHMKPIASECLNATAPPSQCEQFGCAVLREGGTDAPTETKTQSNLLSVSTSVSNTSPQTSTLSRAHHAATTSALEPATHVTISTTPALYPTSTPQSAAPPPPPANRASMTTSPTHFSNESSNGWTFNLHLPLVPPEREPVGLAVIMGIDAARTVTALAYASSAVAGALAPSAANKALTVSRISRLTSCVLPEGDTYDDSWPDWLAYVYVFGIPIGDSSSASPVVLSRAQRGAGAALSTIVMETGFVTAVLVMLRSATAQPTPSLVQQRV